MVTTEKSPPPGLLGAEELAYADADVDSSGLGEESNGPLPEPTSTTTADDKGLALGEEGTLIFAMDENCMELAAEEQEGKEKCPPQAEATDMAVVPDEGTAATDMAKTNGHTSSSSSSLESSGSSRSSPRSLSTSVTAASTLHRKFNGHMTATASLFNGTPPLSGSQISRHVQLHNHNWNGSRSSVSAEESATHQHQQHAAAAASLSLRHSFSTSSNYTETLSSLLRNSANTCSKDTLLFIDQQNHHASDLMEDDDESYMGRSLWVSWSLLVYWFNVMFINNPIVYPDIALNAPQTDHRFSEELNERKLRCRRKQKTENRKRKPEDTQTHYSHKPSLLYTIFVSREQ